MSMFGTSSASFEGAAAEAASGSSGGLFGNLFSGPASGGLFSGSSAAASTGGLFSSAASSGGGLFGSSASSGGLFSSAASSGGSLFSSATSSSGSLFGSAASSGGLFGSAAPAGGGLFGSAASTGGGLFGGAAAQTADASKPEANEDDEYVAEEEVTHIPGWQASVSLDVQDKVQTGEEDEEELYSQRSKLYRFRDGEWKERGLGESKLLKDKATGKIRFLLRQEKTLKIVANHFVLGPSPYCELAPNAGSDKCWVWNTPADNAEETPEETKFALKFGNPDLAQEFKTKFEEVKKENEEIPEFKALIGGSADAAPKAPAAAPAATSKASPPAAPAATPASTGGLFGFSKAASPAVSETSAASSGSVFSSVSTGGGLFASSASTGGLFGSIGTASTGGLFSQAASSGGLFSSAASSGGGLFSSTTSSSGGLFGSAASSGGLFSSAASASGGLFGSAASTGGGLFGSAGAQTADTSKPEANEDDEYVAEEEVTHIPGWQASVTLDVRDKVETGEEDEEELYSQRSKLLRFRDGEWKERGLGDSKLLKNKNTGLVRFLLRQEKTGKIVGNFALVDDPGCCELKPNAGSEVIWTWLALDCSEEEPQMESLALKFKTPELAAQFKEAFDQAKLQNAALKGKQSTNTPAAPAPRVVPPRIIPKAPPKAPEETTEPQNTPFSSLSFSSASSSGGLFGGFNSSGGLFGNASGGLFSGSSSSSFAGSATGGLFSDGGASSSGGIFGGLSSASSSAPSGGLFSGTASGGLFSSPAQGGLFGGSSSSAAPTSSLWGSPVTGVASANGSGMANGTAEAGADEEQYDVEEEVTQIPGWTPSVSLQVKDVVETGEEEEDEVYCQRAKLLRFRDGEWKERGLGDAKLLRHSKTGKTRFLLRQEKTSKIVANHYVINQKPYCDLQPNGENGKIWVWTALDWADADEGQQVEQFALKFKTEELAAAFKKSFDKAREGRDDEDNEEENEDEDEDDSEWVQAGSWDNNSGFGNSGGGSLAAMAAAQANASGWRCPGCRLQWGEDVLECSVCEIARPGFEEQAAAAKAGKDKGKQDAAAMFLGSSAAATSAAPAATGFSFSSTSSAPLSFGFGTATPAVASTAPAPLFGTSQSSGSSLFGNAQSSGSLLFGNAQSSSSSSSSSSSLFGSGQSSGSAFGGFGTQSSSSSLFGATSAGSSSGVSLFGSAPTVAPSSIFSAPSKSSPQGKPATSPVSQPSAAPSAALQLSPQAAPAAPPKAAESLCAGQGSGMFQAGNPQASMPGFMQPTGMPCMGMPGMMGMGQMPDPNMLALMQRLIASQAALHAPPATGSNSSASDAAIQLVEEKMRKLESSFRDQQDLCKRADDRARQAEDRSRKAEDAVDALRHENKSIRLQQEEDKEYIRRLQNRCEEQQKMIDGLKRDLQSEREVRASLEAAQKRDAETLKSALEVANSALQISEGAQKSILQMRDERESGITTAHGAMDSLERNMKERLETLESRIEKLPAPSSGSAFRCAPERISYFQNLQSGRRLGNGEKTGSNTDQQETTPPVAAAPKPLMRRIP
eukprot:TRINITY_DN1723_c0_g1_i4.p1 TRINITY_DN1723_c0_g1~~TRINITY_DN1723_c0_g1_i4.p1  ORF type:complete len:1766 (-),score=480.20 TRINITY_DN1723_c0_g1_i4:70-4698(-)